MYTVFKSAITNGEFKLESMLERVRMYAAKGHISMDEMEELEALAREKASVKGDTDLFEKVMELETRVRALEKASGTDEEEESYPAYIAGKWYYNGDRCSENGKNYVCIAPEGVVCTWAPSGYPAYWELVTE